MRIFLSFYFLISSGWKYYSGSFWLNFRLFFFLSHWSLSAYFTFFSVHIHLIIITIFFKLFFFLFTFHKHRCRMSTLYSRLLWFIPIQFDKLCLRRQGVTFGSFCFSKFIGDTPDVIPCSVKDLDLRAFKTFVVLCIITDIVIMFSSTEIWTM